MASAMRVGQLPECPVCLDAMTAPIFNCANGHSLCNTCNTQLQRSECPICRGPMTLIRNRDLESYLAEVKVECRNRPAGCIYKLRPAELDAHLKECIFRDIACPLNTNYSRCSWDGKMNSIMNHVSSVHPDSHLICSEDKHILIAVNVDKDYNRMFLTNVGKSLFIITFEILAQHKMSYWCTQVIGNKNMAQQWIYEVQILNEKNPRQKISYTDYCISYQDTLDEVYRSSRCSVLSANALANFIQDSKLTFKYTLKRLGPVANKDNKSDTDNRDGKKPPRGGKNKVFNAKTGQLDRPGKEKGPN